jgi:hypothetical protein
MSKRWATWPRGIRWQAGIAIVVLALAIVWVLFVPLADWLARHDVGPVKGALRETAVDNARGRLLTLEHSHEQWPPSDHPASRGQEPSTRPDVQAALTVVGPRLNEGPLLVDCRR